MLGGGFKLTLALPAQNHTTEKIHNEMMSQPESAFKNRVTKWIMQLCPLMHQARARAGEIEFMSYLALGTNLIEYLPMHQNLQRGGYLKT